MRFLLEFIILIGLVALGATITRSVFSIWSKRRERKIKREEEMWQELREALSSNSKHRLENIVILYDKELPTKVKPIIQYRIDDLTIQESDKDLERKLEL